MSFCETIKGAAMNRIIRIAGMLALALMASGCSQHVLSEAQRSAIDIPGGFQQLSENPEAAVGKTLLLGGIIIENQVGREGTTLKIKPYTVDNRGIPRRPFEGEEELLATSGRVLDPLFYKAGHLVTLTATYLGREVRGGPEDGYPRMRFRIGEIYIWPRPAHYPYGYRYPYRLY
jgi:outer membrane lipoprotein